MMFDASDFWIKMGISHNIVYKRYAECFGNKEKHIKNRNEAIELVRPILLQLQERIKNEIDNNKSKIIAAELYKILDKCFHLYIEEKAARTYLADNNVTEDTLMDSLRKNSVIELNLISAINVWLENCVLLQRDIADSEVNKTDIDPILCVDLFIYGTLSRALSLLIMSEKLQEDVGYYGIDIVPNDVLPLDVYKDHPIIYYNPIISGNQSLMTSSYNDLKNANNTDFGRGFYDEYGVKFLSFLKVLKSIQVNELADGKYSCIQFTRDNFVSILNYYLNEEDANSFINAFVLDKKKIQSCLGKNDEVIYKTGVNKFRHELRPFLLFEDDSIYIAYTALEQAIQIWVSFFLNGGTAYTDIKDAFSAAQEKRNIELSDELVEIIRGKLQKRYTPDINEINVGYRRIFGDRNEDYGDYDIVFYDRNKKELFLIEAKFFSDSLNNSGLINDYTKLFKDKGYYDHCKGRYKLVLDDPEAVKSFINETENVTLHMLFISSKPIEMELQDKEELVTFISLANIDDYLDRGFISEDGSKIIKPVKKI